MSGIDGLLQDPVQGTLRMVREQAERERRRKGDVFFLVRVAEGMLLRANECRCEHNTCGGCRTVLAIYAELEKSFTGTAEEEAQREKARTDWRAMRTREAGIRGEQSAIAKTHERALARERFP